MNAPARIRSATGSARRDAYIPMVQTFLPGCEGEELKLRCGLLLMRDYASSRLRGCVDEAACIYEQVERLCTLYAYASMSADHLAAFHYQVIRLGTTATDLQRIFGPPPAQEGARGSG